MKPNTLFYAPQVIGFLESSKDFQREVRLNSTNPDFKKFHLEMTVTHGLGYEQIRTEKPEVETEVDLLRHLGEMERKCQETKFKEQFFETCEVGSTLLQTERTYTLSLRQTTQRLQRREEVAELYADILGCSLNALIEVNENSTGTRCNLRDDPLAKRVIAYYQELNPEKGLSEK